MGTKLKKNVHIMQQRISHIIALINKTVAPNPRLINTFNCDVLLYWETHILYVSIIKPTYKIMLLQELILKFFLKRNICDSKSMQT